MKGGIAGNLALTPIKIPLQDEQRYAYDDGN